VITRSGDSWRLDEVSSRIGGCRQARGGGDFFRFEFSPVGGERLQRGFRSEYMNHRKLQQ
jgi:hypothetical protein